MTGSIHLPILAQAGRTPDAPALGSGPGGRVLRYGDLATRVSDLAAILTSLAPPGARVALCLRKQPGMVVAMLGSLAAAMTYVPVDPGWPAARQRLVLADVAPHVVLVPDGDAPDPPLEGAAGAAATVAVGWDGQVTRVSGPAAARAGSSSDGPAPAYILYTSGSTGVPKGVVITHANAAAFIEWAAGAFPLHPADQVVVHAPLHFDLPVYDLYVGLAAGASLWLLPERAALFPQRVFEYLREVAATVLYAVPSALNALVHRSGFGERGLPSLRQLLYAGEEYQPGPLRRLIRAVPQATVANLYGPIETNVVTSLVVTEEHLSLPRVPLGYPVAGAEIALLADDGTLARAGVAEGELLVSGDCVTPGYLNRPDATQASSFWAHRDGEAVRYHRTGDFARRDEAGVLHFLGRRDGLVKTRGFRVELGDIEACLTSLDLVREAAALAVPDPVVTNQVHALVVPASPRVTAAQIRRRCQDLLPGYMVPEVHLVDDFPRTSTGKIARAELPGMVARRGGADVR